MATAIQCQIASNSDEPVMLFGSASAGNDTTAKDALLVVCDAVGTGLDARAAADAATLARIIYDTFWELLDVHTSDSEPAPTTGSDCADVSACLSDAIMVGLERISWPVAQPDLELSGSASSAATIKHPPTRTFGHNVLVVAVHKTQLVVARYGGGRVYLLRKGDLYDLIDASFLHAESAGYENGHASPNSGKPHLGQLELRGDDRLLVCNDALNRHVAESRIKTLLKASPSSRRTANALIDAATLSARDEVVSLGVLDYLVSRVSSPAPGSPPPTQQSSASGTSKSAAKTEADIVNPDGANSNDDDPSDKQRNEPSTSDAEASSVPNTSAPPSGQPGQTSDVIDIAHAMTDTATKPIRRPRDVTVFTLLWLAAVTVCVLGSFVYAANANTSAGTLSIGPAQTTPAQPSPSAQIATHTP